MWIVRRNRKGRPMHTENNAKCLQDALPEGLPHIAYVLLWFPLFTQPFIFREVEGLKKCLPLTVYTLYGPNLVHCSEEILAVTQEVRTFGAKAVPIFLFEFLRLLFSRPFFLLRLFSHSLFHRWPSLEVLGENLWAFLAGLYLGRLFKEDGIDMIYAPWPRGTATAAWVASEIAGIPFATSARGDNLNPADPDLDAKLAVAKFVRANNAADQARIEGFGSQGAKGKTSLVYNSLTLPLPDAGTLPPRQAFHSPLRLLALGRFDVTKGFDVLLKACGILRNQGVKFTLTLAGGGGKAMGLGALDKELHRLRQELSLEDIVSMPGLVSHNELPLLLNEHDIFMAPCIIHQSGKRDGIPNTVIEALSFGIPVISTNVNALPEIVRNGDTGLTVPPQDADALANAVVWMTQNPEEAMRMAENGKKLARNMFDVELNSQRLAKLFVDSFAKGAGSCAG